MEMGKLQEFAEFLAKKGLSKNTLESYLGKVKHYHDLNLNGTFWSGLRDPGTRAAYFYALKRYDEFSGSKITAGMEPPRPKTRLPEILSHNETESLKSFDPAKYRKSHLRCRALFYFLYGTSLRISEALSIKVEDFRRDKIKVLAKGGKEIEVMIPDKSRREVEEYLGAREQDSPWIFCGKAGKPWNRRCAAAALSRWGRKMGIKLYPHKLRHSFAKYLLDKGVNLKAIKEFLHHSSLKTTEIYLALNDEERKKIFFQNNPFSDSPTENGGY